MEGLPNNGVRFVTRRLRTRLFKQLMDALEEIWLFS